MEPGVAMTGLLPFLPCLVLAGFFLVVAPRLPKDKSWARTLMVAIGLGASLRYLVWRFTDTVWPAALFDAQGIWFLSLYSYEALAFLTQLLLHLVLTRVSNRSPEADRYEAELRRTAAEQLPSVDVFICTFNEEIDVLERTIVAALALDYPKFKVWVLDDGKRDWLRDYCAAKGAGYLRRPDNRHAKAGNLNHALGVTDGELFAVLDADFAPLRNFLYRTVGFFRDPKIAIVQTPQHFFNPDPMQLNLGIVDAWPDDQRLFFDVILPARDAWDCAWCCGSCSVQRRSAIAAIGGVPTDSITEDLLSTVVLLRRGQVTRYLNERLSMGLSPENLKGFFRQRERWCRGNLQTLFLRTGPLAPGLSLFKRLLFLPVDWVVHYVTRLLTILVPILFLWTGVGPFLIPSLEELLAYQLPVFLAMWSVIRWFAPHSYMPLLSTASTLFGSFRIVPAALSTLIKPFGTPFKVTPKGSSITFDFGDLTVLGLAVLLMLLTIGGLIKNRVAPVDVAQGGAVRFIAEIWALTNVVLLALAALIALESPRPRREERFPADEPARYLLGESESPCRLVNLSASGALLAGAGPVPVGVSLYVVLDGVGRLSARVVRTQGDHFAVQFEDLSLEDRDRLIHAIYSAGRLNAVQDLNGWRLLFGVVKRVVKI
ncbi:MAG TPA: glycosyltransferase [Gemmataceae bacterium]|jgi:cellulose synthase (UDP-forming)